jgi:hypothetical protein
LDDIVGAWTARPLTAHSDPETCGEDLARNLDIIAEVADSLCTACAGHHIRYALSRLVIEKTPINIDRAEMIGYIRDYILAVGIHRDTIDIVIAGAADTGILATCAHAAASLGALAARVRYTVIDICETPLVLCRRFGEWHGLDVVTKRMDLTQTDARFEADIVVLHSILRQIPPESHRSMLAELKTWLKPDGMFLFSSRLHHPAPRLPKERQIEILAERQRNGELRLNVTLEKLAEGLVIRRHWSHDFESTEEMAALFHESGLLVKHEHYVEKRCDGEGLSSVEGRYVAILAPARYGC